jgi:hypothetical protein
LPAAAGHVQEISEAATDFEKVNRAGVNIGMLQTKQRPGILDELSEHEAV